MLLHEGKAALEIRAALSRGTYSGTVEPAHRCRPRVRPRSRQPSWLPRTPREVATSGISPTIDP